MTSLEIYDQLYQKTDFEGMCKMVGGQYYKDGHQLVCEIPIYSRIMQEGQKEPVMLGSVLIDVGEEPIYGKNIRVMGTDAKENIRVNFGRFESFGDAGRLAFYCTRTKDSKGMYRVHCTIPREDGAAFTIDSYMYPVPREDGTIDRYPVHIGVGGKRVGHIGKEPSDKDLTYIDALW